MEKVAEAILLVTDEKVNVIAHKTPCEQLDLALLETVRQELEKAAPRGVVFEENLPPAPPHNDMVEAVLRFFSWPSHVHPHKRLLRGCYRIKG